MDCKARIFRLALALLIFAPAFFSFNYIFRFGVNVPFWDQWEFVPLLGKSYDGTVAISDLVRPHNEHIIFFPRLLMLLVAHLTRYNVVAEMYCSWLLQCLTAILLLSNHLKTFGADNIGLASFVPVSWLIFSLRQSENLLWGWQVQVFLCSFCIIASLLSLSKAAQQTGPAVVAVAAALVASFSFAGGLAIWPVGFVYLLWLHSTRRPESRRRFLFVALIWSCTALLVLLAYYSVAVTTQLPPSNAGDYFKFMLVILGGALAPDVSGSVAMGSMLVALTIVLSVLALSRGVHTERGSLALPLILFSATVAVLLLRGRFAYGEDLAATSRYTTLTSLGIIGLYRGSLSVKHDGIRGLTVGFMLALVGLGIISAFDNAYTIGKNTRNGRLAAAEILRHYDSRPDSDINGPLYAFPSLVRERAAVLVKNHLSVFSDKSVR
jgi:hypothetical protein